MDVKVSTTGGPVAWKQMFDEAKERYRAGDRSWIPTTDEMAQEMLDVLPPAYWRGPFFAVGEAYTHDSNGSPVFACFYTVEGKACMRYATDVELDEEASQHTTKPAFIPVGSY